RHHRRANGQELNEILREDQIERPVDGDAAFLLEARQLAEINRSPEPPGEKPGEVDPEYTGDASPPADRRELADRPELEGARGRALQARGDVAGHPSRLAQRVLRRRRVRPPAPPV